MHALRSACRPNAELARSGNEPHTAGEFNRLIQSDSELAWPSSDYVEIKQEEGTSHFSMITWNGRSCFLWYEDQITCATPEDVQAEKLIDIAEKLSANVVGDDGEQYVLAEQSLREA